MSLFVLSCKDGWVSIMYDGLDAVGVDQQVNTQMHTQRGIASRKCKIWGICPVNIMKCGICVLVLFNMSIRQQ